MKHILYKIILFILMILVVVEFSITKVKATYNDLPDTFRFNYKGEAVATRPSFSLEKIVSKDEIGIELGSIKNFYVGKSKIFIVDSIKNQIIILNCNFEKLHIINNENYEDILNTPEGIWETDEGNIYVANKGNNNILVFNSEYLLIKKIEKPENMIGTTSFAPSKIAVDGANRIYVVVQGSSEGIVELTNDGEFIRYFGTNETKINIVEYFWRMFSTEQQKKTLGIVTAPPFNNIFIANGFYYTTASNPDALENVKKFNSKGIDILVRNGYFPIVGNVEEGYNINASSLTSVSVNDYGLLSILDSNNGHVYIYDNKGYLLSVLGGIGEGKGELFLPQDVRWFGNKLIVSDNRINSLLVYKPTKFGNAIMNAHKTQMDGKYKESYQYWQEVLKYDSNYERAYVGIARYYYYELEDYKQAMKYYKLGYDREGYGIAYTSYRDEFLKENYFLIFIPIILLLGIVFYSEYRYVKKSGD